MYLFGFFRRIQYSKKQPPDTFLISDGCFLLYFIPQLFCCHVALCLNFTLFAALPLLVCSFDSAKVKLICNICACQVYYFAVVTNSIDLVITFYISRKWLRKTSRCIDASSCSIRSIIPTRIIFPTGVISPLTTIFWPLFTLKYPLVCR